MIALVWVVVTMMMMIAGITLPFEDGLNPYVSEELAFEFHYFFTRKFWMVYHCQVTHLPFM
jgi:predicted Rossmann-fold nucleotide-binding protein